MNRKEWLYQRKNGLGGSDCSSILGLNPYMSNIELWEIKTGRKEQEDISEKPLVKYGTQAEKHLIELFKLDYPEYKVVPMGFDIIKNKEHDFIFATLDGDLTEIKTGRKGLLEIKTSHIKQYSQFKKWDKQIPDNYYCQVLHCLLATDYDFIVVKAQLKFGEGKEMELKTKHYFIERKDVLEDLEYLKEAEIEFWNYIQEDKKPNLKLPRI